MKRIYLDNSATTPAAREVVEAMQPYFVEHFGNASSLHEEGRDAREAIEKSRKVIADFLHASPGEIIFTGSGTESNNAVLKGLAFSHLGKQRNHIIVSKIEHPAVMEPCRFLEKNGFEVTYLDVDGNGLIDLKKLENAITSKTLVVSIMHANNEIGVLQDIAGIGRICKTRGVLFHTDAVQSFGKIRIDTSKLNVDFISASAHKIYGPKGVGLLYARKGSLIEPLLHGGGHEFGLRSSTENTAGIAGFGKAVEICDRVMDDEAKNLGFLRDRLIENLLKISGARLNGHPKERLYNNVSISFSGVEGESIVLQLDSRGIAASTGSACSSKNLKSSHVLTAIGLDHKDSHGSLRLTLGRTITLKDIDYTIGIIREVIENLRRISPIQ